MKVEKKTTFLCGRPLEECLNAIEQFHGWKAPGMVLGVFMVDWALERLSPGIEADAVVETRHCLPDAVQLFTPCTVGNGWMKVLDWDKYALSLFDRRKRNGFRVWFDLQKAQRVPELYQWFMRTIPKKGLPLEILLDRILEAGREVLSAGPVFMTDLHQRHKKSGIRVCPECGEAYAAVQGKICRSCSGKGYYRLEGDRDDASSSLMDPP